MRQIKFRAKDENEQWVYGNLVQYKEDDGEEITCIVSNERCNVSAELVFTQVNPETIGQFTGLYDNNGKEMYEGDIIECEQKQYICEYVEGGFEFKDLSDGRLILKAIVIHSHIIGNIHDNPDLIYVPSNKE